jgi:hypothetical protein
MAVASLPARSCQIDGEAIVSDESGLAVFNLIRGHRSLAVFAEFISDAANSRQCSAISR